MSGLPIQILFGGAGVGNTEKFKTADDVKPFFDVLKKQGVTKIDTAHLYGNSETYLGEVKAGDSFTFDTKWLGGFGPGNVTKDKMIASAKDSIRKLGVAQVRPNGVQSEACLTWKLQVDVFYLHAPDKTVPIEDTLEGVNEVYKLGIFKRFGLSVCLPGYSSGRDY